MTSTLSTNIEEIKPEPSVELSEDKNMKGSQLFSSGEKQIISLLYAAHISGQETILIDEPEISLHIDWQERLLDAMEKQLAQKQIVVCTHSPMIGGYYSDDVVKPMNISRTQSETWGYMSDLNLHKEEEEDINKEEFKPDVYDELIEKELIQDIPLYSPSEDEHL